MYNLIKKVLVMVDTDDHFKNNLIFPWEYCIRSSPIEIGLIFKNINDEVFLAYGEKNVCPIPEDIWINSGHKIFTHSHPDEIPLDVGDMITACSFNLKEIRAVTDKFIYSMKNDINKMSYDLLFKKPDKNKNILYQMLQYYNHNINQRYNENTLTNEVGCTYLEKMYNRIATNYGLKYTKMPIDNKLSENLSIKEVAINNQINTFIEQYNKGIKVANNIFINNNGEIRTYDEKVSQRDQKRINNLKEIGYKYENANLILDYRPEEYDLLT
jgi:hypothetical protein